MYGPSGENFTIEGGTDEVVCIGDRYRIGTALFEVAQPRIACHRVGIRMNEPRKPALRIAGGRPGLCLRVEPAEGVRRPDPLVVPQRCWS